LIFRYSVIKLFTFTLLFWLLGISISNAAVNHPHLKRICYSVSGVVTINWYLYTDTCNKFDKILIYGRQDPDSSFRPIDSIKYNTNNYVFLNGFNFLSGSFFIEYVSNCPGRTISFSDTMVVDVIRPPVTQPDSVSVLSDGSVVVGWSTIPAILYSDTKSFLLNVVKGSKIFPIDTVYRNQGNSGVVKNSGANVGPVTYSLAAVDSCDNISPVGPSHTTIFLEAGQDSCKYTVTLSWLPYLGWGTSVKYYEVYYSLDSSKGYKLYGNATGTNFTLSDLLNFKKYFFFVRAVKNSSTRITSSSNRITLTTQFQKVFNYVYIKTVSVVGNSIQVDWATSNDNEVGYFELYRGKNTGQMKLITRINGGGLVNGLYTYVDSDVDPSTDIWFYKVIVYNTCGHEAGISNIPHNILLNLTKVGRTKNLTWNMYDQWSGGVFLYNVLRTVENSNPTSQLIGFESPLGLSYTDVDSFSDYVRPGVCYQIKALEGDSDKFGFRAESFSNTVCYIDPPIVFIPNAFVPDEGVNKVFKPVVSLTDTVNSVMSIYNRWGELIFKTNHIIEGWDGKTKDGNWAPSNVYMYVIEVIGLDNTPHAYTGLFTLL